MASSNAACSDEVFIETWRRLQSPSEVAKVVGTSLRNAQARGKRIEARHGIVLPTRCHTRIEYDTTGVSTRYVGRINVDMKDGQIVVFSDAHYMPGEVSTAHRALLYILAELKPSMVVNNGDAFDGSSISRHPRIGWDKKPTVLDELRAVADRLTEIERVAKRAKLYWPLGNHDARFETFLAASAPQYEGVHGFSLKDHFPRWTPCWSVFVNNTCMIKHRQANGIHAVYNNTLKAGTSMVTGHLHSLKVTPWTDYLGDRYGVDTGTLADCYGPQFDYIEDGYRNWRSGFAVLTIRGGKLMPPELVHVVEEGKFFWRGQVIEV